MQVVHPLRAVNEQAGSLIQWNLIFTPQKTQTDIKDWQSQVIHTGRSSRKRNCNVSELRCVFMCWHFTVFFRYFLIFRFCDPSQIIYRFRIFRQTCLSTNRRSDSNLRSIFFAVPHVWKVWSVWRFSLTEREPPSARFFGFSTTQKDNLLVSTDMFYYRNEESITAPPASKKEVNTWQVSIAEIQRIFSKSETNLSQMTGLRSFYIKRSKSSEGEQIWYKWQHVWKESTRKPLSTQTYCVCGDVSSEWNR